MTREVRTEPRTSHRLLEGVCRVSVSCFIIALVSRSCRYSYDGSDFEWVLAHSCPWLRVSRSTSSSPMGRVRWAREAIPRILDGWAILDDCGPHSCPFRGSVSEEDAGCFVVSVMVCAWWV